MEQIHNRLPLEFVEQVLEAFHHQQIPEAKACELLDVKRVHLYRLRKRWFDSHRRSEDFQLYGRRESNFHHFDEEVEAFLHQQLHWIRYEADNFRGKFNFAHLAELASLKFKFKFKFKRPFHRNSIRRFAIRHGYYHQTAEEKRKPYCRFEMPQVGMLFQHDSSNHCWMPALGGEHRQDLIITKDDHSRMIVGASLVERETAFDHLSLARQTMVNFGRPLAYYVDRDSLYYFGGFDGTFIKNSKSSEEASIQFLRALKALDVGLIYANTPQAKGKVEKQFNYLQWRVPMLCEQYKVVDPKDANKILVDVIGYYNEQRVHSETKEIPSVRWKRAIGEGRSSLRPLEEETDLDRVFALQYIRTVRKDSTIQFLSRSWKVGGGVGQQVEVCLLPQLPKQKLIVYHQNQKIAEYLF